MSKAFNDWDKANPPTGTLALQEAVREAGVFEDLQSSVDGERRKAWNAARVETAREIAEWLVTAKLPPDCLHPFLGVRLRGVADAIRRKYGVDDD